MGESYVTRIMVFGSCYFKEHDVRCTVHILHSAILHELCRMWKCISSSLDMFICADRQNFHFATHIVYIGIPYFVCVRVCDWGLSAKLNSIEKICMQHNVAFATACQQLVTRRQTTLTEPTNKPKIYLFYMMGFGWLNNGCRTCYESAQIHTFLRFKMVFGLYG